MTIEFRDVLYLGATLVTGISMLVRLDSTSKEQTRQHGELKIAVDGLAKEVKGLGRDASSHEARIDGVDTRIDAVDQRVDRVEARVDLIARRA